MNLPVKANFGEPCTRCGQCCAAEVCGMMLSVNPEAKPPCPALGYSQEHNLFACTIVQVEQFTELEKDWHLTKALGIGKGCDSE